MKAEEERARDFIETLLIDIHWQGKPSGHPADVAWLESRVDHLAPQVTPLVEAVKREARAAAIEECAAWIKANSTSSSRMWLAESIRALADKEGSNE